MADETAASDCALESVPVDQIRRTRRDFPDCRLTYEIQVEGDGWPALARLADACGAAGLTLISLKCHSNGTIFCLLGDQGRADLDLLASCFGHGLTVIRWATIIANGRPG